MHDEGASDSTEREEIIPLFPLHSVLLPGVLLPMHIFEPRYRQLIGELIAGKLPDGEFGVLAIRNTLVDDVHEASQLHEIGCTAILREAEHLEDGRFDIVTTGARRFRLRHLLPDEAPYLLGNVEWLDEQRAPVGDPTTAVANASARAAHERYCGSAWADGDWAAPAMDVPPERLAYLLAEDSILPMDDKQALLSEPDPVRRLRMISALLNREAGFLTTLRAVPVQQGNLDELRAPAMYN